MSTYLEYKGYQGTIEPEIDSGLLYGKVTFIRDLVTYQATTVPELKKEFETSVDDYLADCQLLEKTPDKPFKGSFNVRTGEELHRLAVMSLHGQSLNAFVCEAIKEKVENIHV